jgi:hypothetical protein
MAADMTNASRAPRKSARRDAAMIHFRLPGASAAGEGVEKDGSNRIQETF